MDKQYIAKNINRFPLVDKEHKILELCAGKKVLNVGCVGQDQYYESDSWQHKKIAAAAEEITGVDIQEDEIAKLRQMGYEVFMATELEQSSRTFDVILMSDVIEHVNNPHEFLEFYARFLNPDGIMLVSTPNAFYFARFLWILIWKNYSVNEEHTLWYCPLTIAELVSRTSLEITDFYWCNEYFDIRKISFRYRWIYKLSRFFARSRRNFSPNFMLELSLKK